MNTRTGRPIPLFPHGACGVLQRPGCAGRRERQRRSCARQDTASQRAADAGAGRPPGGHAASLEDHITWTRLAIISLTTGSPDTDATVGRLLQNQVDIGNAVKPFYGEAAGNELTSQLRKHILIAADVIAAAKAGDAGKLAEAQGAGLRTATTSRHS